MEEYPSNSHGKNDAPVEKVIRGEVSRRKKPLGKRFAETFTGADATSVSEHIVLNIVVPAIKNMINDSITQGVSQALFGQPRGSTGGSTPRQGGSRVQYERYAEPARTSGPSMSRRARAGHDFEDLIFDSHGEATEVLDHLYAILEKSEVVSVSDLYHLVGIKPDYPDSGWGWFRLHGSRVVPVRGNGFILELPRPKPID